MNKKLLVIGPTSSIASATMNCFASNGYDLFLAGRDLEEMARQASDVAIRYGVNVKIGLFDAEKVDEHFAFLQNAALEMDGFNGAILAFGTLGEQPKAISDFREAKKILDCNFIGACSIAHHLGNYFSEKKSGFLAGISSVAGDRGRQSNYVYGAAKGGFSLFLQGMRNRLYSDGVQVSTIKPGFVDTAMTYGLPNIPFMASPENVGKEIYRGIVKGKDVIYVPGFWRYIMLVIKLIPEKIFKRLKL